MKSNSYYVYILTNNSHTLYIGVTNNLAKRVYEHENKLAPGFTERYNLHKLVYYETCTSAYEAICFEKYLKGKTRQKKMDIIKSKNPTFRNLKEDLV